MHTDIHVYSGIRGYWGWRRLHPPNGNNRQEIRGTTLHAVVPSGGEVALDIWELRDTVFAFDEGSGGVAVIKHMRNGVHGGVSEGEAAITDLGASGGFGVLGSHSGASSPNMQVVAVALKWDAEPSFAQHQKDAAELGVFAPEDDIFSRGGFDLIYSAKDSVLRVGHAFEHSAAALAIRRLWDEGVLGTLRYVSMRRVGLGRHQRDTSVLWDLAVHDVSSLFGGVGAPRRQVHLPGRSVRRERGFDVSFLGLGFDGGLVATIESSWLAPERSRLIQLVGSHASLEYPADETEERLRLVDSHASANVPTPSQHRGGSHAIELSGPSAIERELEEFLAGVRAGRSSEAHRAQAVAVTRVLERAEAGASSQRLGRVSRSIRVKRRLGRSGAEGSGASGGSAALGQAGIVRTHRHRPGPGAPTGCAP